MQRLLLHDVRCFRGEHEVPLAPLTLLVGENSTGKSTLLALTRIAWDLIHGRAEPDFNEEPFQLGSFGEIAHLATESAKPTARLSVGVTLSRLIQDQGAGGDLPLTVRGTFVSEAGQPALGEIELSRGLWGAQVHRTAGREAVQFRTPAGSFSSDGSPFARNIVGGSRHQWPAHQSAGLILRYHAQEGSSGLMGLSADEVQNLLALLFPSDLHLPRSVTPPRPLAISPVRSRPKRTYDPLQGARSPEGDHVPMLLARLIATDPSWARQLLDEISEYGAASGLFTRLSVRRFPGGDGAPFQVLVQPAGQTQEVNLIDVGYGVSQVLPILVDALIAKAPASFLLQQPEVHLHPRAQAALGSLLASLTQSRKHRFMVETHSDHLVDRVRLEVRRGTLPPEAVALVFCERQGTHVQLHNLTLDEQGNVLGAPDSYRQFFLDEELALLTT